MQHVLVIVATEEDARAIPTVIKMLSAFKPRAVVVLNNPSVGIAAANATAAVDQKIAELERSKNEAVAREDFPAASQFKQQIEDAKVERMDVLRDGWKSIPEDQRIAAYDKLTDGFKVLNQASGTYVVGITLSEDSEPSNILSAISNLGPSWPECLPAGRFTMVWPQDASELAPVATPQPVQSAPRVETAKPAPKPQKKAPKEPTTPDEWRAHLKPYFSMRKKALELGVPMDGRKGSEVIEDIIVKMFGAVAA